MKKIIIIGVIAVVLIVGGILAYFLVFKSEPKEVEVVYFEYEFDEDYCNIADAGKIAKIVVVIEYTDEAILEQLNSKNTVLVNNINELFRREKYEDISKATGMQRLREKIKQMVVETLESDTDIITNVYFKVFIIQG
ncbi:MAG: flagellar basal body-associated FliL family protein [Bacillota bacterium]|nr:flagellar basal body-associated FliL family protein [Bacillota bacterium]